MDSMLSHDLIDILACPACRGALAPLEEGRYLLCRPCGLRFPVKDGIPVMLLDAAEPVADHATPETSP